jgi:hypothetical protein
MSLVKVMSVSAVLSFNPGWQDITSAENRNQAVSMAADYRKRHLRARLEKAKDVVEQAPCWKTAA